MSYFIHVKAKQFIQKLQRPDAEIIKGRGKGGHYLVKYKGRQTTVPVHGDADMSPVFIRKFVNNWTLTPTRFDYVTSLSCHTDAR